MKIVFINSHGPMGSTCIASIIEHFGFNNIPLRKLGLLESIYHKKQMSTEHMIQRFKKIIIKHSNLRVQGGVNIIDRNASKPIKLLDIKKIEDELEVIIKKNIENPVLLYEQLREIYKNSILYKENKYDYLGNIELTVRVHHFDPKELYKVIQKNFKDFYIISIRRDFTTWVNSLISQWYHNKNKKFVFKLLNIRGLYSDYCRYNKFIDDFPGMKIDFDDIFLPNTKKIIEDLKVFFDVQKDIDWENKSYDLYGKNVDFNKTFSKRDDNIEYLTKNTQNLIKSGQKNIFNNLINLFLINFFYFFSVLTMKFRLKTKN